MDLRGYGWSAAPDSKNGETYTKRQMAADAVKVMENLGHIQFALVGHDRGARVGLRLALDHPGGWPSSPCSTSRRWRKALATPICNGSAARSS